MSDDSLPRTERIAYGDETTLKLAGYVLYIAPETDRCPDCHVEQGDEHEYGCSIEQCPLCERRLLGCHHNHRSIQR